jgi:Protein of unknown function (DUF3303)
MVAPRGHGTGHKGPASWIDPIGARCFQVMEADSATALEPWMDRSADVIDFDVVPVLSSAAYRETV